MPAKREPRSNRKGQLVKVEWRDAHGGAKVGWKDVADAAATGTIEAVSFGIVLKETAQTIVIAPHFVAEDEKPLDYARCRVDGEIAIPQKWIVNVTRLVEQPNG